MNNQSDHPLSLGSQGNDCMEWLQNTMGWLSLAIGVLWANGIEAAPRSASPIEAAYPYTQNSPVPTEVPLDGLPANERDLARRVLEHPTLKVDGPLEVF